MAAANGQPMYFIIVLIGGPGIVAPCDPHHDRTWTDYIVPIQLATSQHQVQLEPGETMQWWVYGPAYRERWEDDAKGKSQVQQREVAKVKTQGGVDYISRIRAIAVSVGASVKILERPSDFWTGLQNLPDNSVNRLW